MFDALYVNKKQLEAIFNFYDKDGDGSISREEFVAGCQVINAMLPPEDQLQEPERLLDLMDFNKNDSVEINEFFEVGHDMLSRLWVESPEVYIPTNQRSV